MSYLNDLPVLDRRPAPRSNIRGATGLSRRALAGVIAEVGLFGRDSALGQTDQAIVQSMIGPIPGVASVEQSVQQHSGQRCQVLAELTQDAIIGGGVASQATRVAARNIGLATSQINEIERVIAKVSAVFGLPAANIELSCPSTRQDALAVAA